jgi:hypothetical protein
VANLHLRNGRWRSTYIYTPSSPSLTGTINVDVHYYEDGNVRLTTKKQPEISVSSNASATEIVRQIALVEKKYQEELNRGFTALSEGAFKGLRRQLPVTRQKVEWEKVGSYRVSGYIWLSELQVLLESGADWIDSLGRILAEEDCDECWLGSGMHGRKGSKLRGS